MQREVLHNELRTLEVLSYVPAELAELYTRRYVERVTAYHAGIFRSLIAAGQLREEDPDALALLYAAPVITLIGICDRQPEKEAACRERLEAHVRLFFRTFQADGAGT